jgi:hypothetical protein
MLHFRPYLMQYVGLQRDHEKVHLGAQLRPCPVVHGGT